jgi:hypothetical protein
VLALLAVAAILIWFGLVLESPWHLVGALRLLRFVEQDLLLRVAVLLFVCLLLPCLLSFSVAPIGDLCRPAGVAAAGGGFLCAEPVVVCSLRSDRSF